jgi:oligopeptide/dipeptide ABC transporter ATP-binding protein
MTTDVMLDIRSLRVEYAQGRSERFVAANDVSFTVERGTVFGLVGESGSGKSTVARAVARLVPATGEVDFDGTNWLQERGAALRRLRPKLQMVFQDPYSSLDPRMDVERIVGEGLDIHRIGTVAERRARAGELLELVGLSAAQGRRKPFALSGGQRQRVAIARALATDPKLVILDEPISALDVSIQAQVLNLLSELRARLGLTYVFIVHDLIVAEYFCDRLAVMFGGRIMEMGSSHAIFRAPSHPYTRDLLAAVPVPDPELARRRVAADVGPESSAESHVTVGCPYQHRCTLRKGREVCGEVTPPLTQRDGDHVVACHFASES